MVPSPPRGPIVDPFGRRIRYVRVSVTDRCNFRCVYCMPAAGIDVRPRAEMLTYDEIVRLAGVLAEMGVDKIRLTGGEPTVRRDFVKLVERLSPVPGLRTLTMTTNGWNLAEIARPLRDAGMTRLNVSIDSLRPDRFRTLSRVGELGAVLRGIDTLVDMGWTPFKLNVVMVQGVNDDEAGEFVSRFADVDCEVRFIEWIPFGVEGWRLVPWRDVRARIEERHRLEPLDGADGPAARFAVVGRRARVGRIAALSHQFCSACDRVRVTSDGSLKTCLAYEPRMVSLRDVMRATHDDDALEAAIRAGIAHKPLSHACDEEGEGRFEGAMVRIGG
ncbi:GTP 3',8-cyclase MoaA [Myxococcota bacterium]|nr:GTP 3',8-cyclase MoaA [Myxococcota bacterium]